MDALSSDKKSDVPYMPLLIHLRVLTSAEERKGNSSKESSDSNLLKSFDTHYGVLKRTRPIEFQGDRVLSIAQQLAAAGTDDSGTLRPLRGYIAHTVRDTGDFHTATSGTARAMSVGQTIDLLDHYRVRRTPEEFRLFITDIGLFPSPARDKGRSVGTDSYGDPNDSERRARSGTQYASAASASNRLIGQRSSGISSDLPSDYRDVSLDARVLMMTVMEVQCSNHIHTCVCECV